MDTELPTMGTHGFYVWMAYGFCWILILLLVIANRITNKNLLKKVYSQTRKKMGDKPELAK